MDGLFAGGEGGHSEERFWRLASPGTEDAGRYIVPGAAMNRAIVFPNLDYRGGSAGNERPVLFQTASLVACRAPYARTDCSGNDYGGVIHSWRI